MPSMKINREYIWDYPLSELDLESEDFKKWYIARVLVKGTVQDLKDVGFDTIYTYLPELTIPYQIREFWEWFFNLPQSKEKYGHADRRPEDGFKSPVPSPFVKK